MSDPATTAAAQATTWRWYVSFCVVSALLYVLIVVLLLLVILPGLGHLDGSEIFIVILLVGLFLLLALAYGSAPLLPRGPWAWIYGILILGFASFGGCFVFAIPLLVVFVRPEMRAFFGREAAPPPETTPPPPAAVVAPPAAIPPSAPRSRPPVWPWYVALCAVTALLYLGIALVGVASFFDPELAGDPVEDGAMAILGSLLFPVCAAGAFLPRRPWAWSYGLAVLVIAMLACCTLPAAVPILVAWMKPETKAAFGRV